MVPDMIAIGVHYFEHLVDLKQFINVDPFVEMLQECFRISLKKVASPIAGKLSQCKCQKWYFPS